MKRRSGRTPLTLLACLSALAGCSGTAPQSGTGPSPFGELTSFIADQMTDHALPALSIAILDGDRVVFAEGFGWLDAAHRTPATATTVYRVASISKLFTDTAVMQLVERGELDLDQPVARYLPDFQPHNDYDQDITLRLLMTHHAGLVREPPVGHYFDAAQPSLAATVQSLNDTRVVWPPGQRLRYSNAGIAVVGRVLEARTGRPFAEHVQQAILAPLGLADSSFAPSAALAARLASGIMWTYDGREFPAPTFALGMAPAANLCSTVLDLVRFAASWFSGARTPLLQPATAAAMLSPQFPDRSGRSRIGLGFFLGELDGQRTIGHSGAYYGAAAQLLALPDARLAAAVVTNVDCANSVVDCIAERALRTALAARAGQALAAAERPVSLGRARARQWVGLYRDGDLWRRLVERDGELYAEGASGYRTRIRACGERLIVDDRLERGAVLERRAGGIAWNNRFLALVDDARPPAIPAAFAGLIGEYGWDHDVLYVLEREGLLSVLIEWFAYYPLRQNGDNDYVMPPHGLYAGEEVTFVRDASGQATSGQATSVQIGGVTFPRRPIGPPPGETFRIQPLHPPERLRALAKAAAPPRETGQKREPDLVELTALEPTIRLDLRYATANNFLGVPLYERAKALMQRPAAAALVRVQRALRERGYGLLVFDAYRPWHVTKMFWDATPEGMKDFVADPQKGSRHNRGCAVDLTLCDLATGAPVDMVSGYDEFTPRAFPEYPGGTSLARWHRELLSSAMAAEGFTVYEYEWWHFDFQDWKEYPILDVPFP